MEKKAGASSGANSGGDTRMRSVKTGKSMSMCQPRLGVGASDTLHLDDIWKLISSTVRAVSGLVAKITGTMMLLQLFSVGTSFFKQMFRSKLAYEDRYAE